MDDNTTSGEGLRNKRNGPGQEGYMGSDLGGDQGKGGMAGGSAQGQSERASQGQGPQGDSVSMPHQRGGSGQGGYQGGTWSDGERVSEQGGLNEDRDMGNATGTRDTKPSDYDAGGAGNIEDEDTSQDGSLQPARGSLSDELQDELDE